MRKLLLLFPFILASCTISQKIIYSTDNLDTPLTTELIPIIVDVRILADNRASFEENDVLFNNPRQIRLNGKSTCINSEKHYKKDTVVNQITRLMVDHFNKGRLFKMCFYDHSQYSDYYLTGILNSLYGEQEFSSAAAVGAQFGLLGALATSGARTPGRIVIDISDIKLYNKVGSLVKDFGSFYKEYNEEFKADATCWCIYWNINDALKDFNTHLIEKIRNEMADIELNQ